jgi:hypothetical protein
MVRTAQLMFYKHKRIIDIAWIGRFSKTANVANVANVEH